jgi:hypothetical protein
MRYQPAHAAKSGSVPFMLRGPKSARTVLSAVVAGAIAFAPAVLLTSPAQADVLAGFSFDATTVTEDEGGDFVFQVTRALSDDELDAEDLDWTISTGVGLTDATSNVDYTNDTGELNFLADDTPDGNGKFGGDTLTFTVHSLQDERDEQTESFTVSVTDGTDTDEATGRIDDDDDAPGYTLVVDDETPTEGTGAGTHPVTVTAELDEVSGKAVTIPITVEAGTAKLDQDYTYTPGSITIPANSTTVTGVTVGIVRDSLYEENEQSFTVKGGTHSSVTGTDDATVTIIDDEAQPEININSDSAVEGGSLDFEVSLSRASERAVTATYTTADGPGSDDPDSLNDDAKAGSDYTAGTGTVTFPAATSNTPGASSTAQKISVKTTSDSINEGPEDLHVTLSNAGIGTLGEDTVATGTITDNDTAPTATVSPTAAVTEGSSGRAAKTYTVTLNKESGRTVEVDYDVEEGAGTATAVADFIPTSGTLTFQPGETTKTFNVDIVGDTMDEPGAAETFEINLSSSGATAADRTISITDDDATPTFSVSPITMDEGDTGSVVVFPVKLSNPSSANTVFTVADVADSATRAVVGDPTGDLDYTVPTTPLTIPAGQTTGYVFFLVNGDEVYEDDEEMDVRLTPTSGNLASATAKTATLTLNNDDDAPTFEVTSVTGEEGQSVNVNGVVTGMAQGNLTFNVNFAGSAVNGSAAASSDDFTNPGTVAVPIAEGTLSGTPTFIASIPLKDDETPEGPETILASGTAVSGTVVNGVVTIGTNDGYTPPPTGPESITLAGPPYRVGPGPVRLTGKTDANTAIQLWSAPYNGGDDDWTEDGAAATSGSTGSFVFNRSLTTTGRKYVVHAGATVSDELRVALRQAPALSVTSTVKGVAYAKVTGGVPRAKFLIQRRNANGTWSTAFTGNLLSNGAYNQRLTGQVSGRTITYRVYVYGNSATGVESAASAARQVRIR